MMKKINDIIGDAKTIGIAGHLRPDGDCMGSCMSLYNYLKKNRPDLDVRVFLEFVDKKFNIIENTDQIITTGYDGTKFDLFISLDTASLDRLGLNLPFYENAKRTACIDHHASNDGYADYNYILPKASSASEVLYDLLDEDLIDKSIAEPMYMGIAHDTGVFQYSCTSPETMEAAAQLLRKGIDGSEIIEKTYFEKTYIQNQILGRALLESMLVLEKQVVVSVVSRKEMEFFEAVPSDLEGIVAQLRQTKGVEVAIFLHELEPQKYKVSLRSKQYIDVSVIAKHFGGGGHIRAAGVTMTGSAHDVINNITEQIARQFEKLEEKSVIPQ